MRRHFMQICRKDTLFDRSLVIRIACRDEVKPRYQLLNAIRGFAEEELAKAGEEIELRSRHANAVGARMDAAAEEPFSGQIGLSDWGQAMLPDLDNARQALAWALETKDASLVLRILATFLFALPTAAHQEAVRVCDLCEPMLELAADPDLQSRAGIRMAARLATTQVARAGRLAHQAANRAPHPTLSERWRWLRYQALAIAATANAHVDLEAAQATLDDMKGLERPTWPPHRRFIGCEPAYAIDSARKDHDAARRVLEHMMDLGRKAGWHLGPIQSNLIDTAIAAGNASAAVLAGVEFVRGLKGGRDENSLCFAQLNLGAAYLALNDTTNCHEPGGSPGMMEETSGCAGHRG